MQSCGGCTANDISLLAQVLMSPATWIVVGATVTSLWSSGKKKVSKKDTK